MEDREESEDVDKIVRSFWSPKPKDNGRVLDTYYVFVYVLQENKLAQNGLPKNIWFTKATWPFIKPASQEIRPVIISPSWGNKFPRNITSL